MRGVRLIGALVVAGWAAAGCTPRASRVLSTEVRTIAITPFANATGEAQLPSLVMEEVRRAFRLDGRLHVEDDAAAADSVLGGAVTEYERQPARFDATNVVREYRLRMAVELTLTDGSRARTLWAHRAAGATAITGPQVLDRSTTQVVVPASGLPVETDADAQLRLAHDLAGDIVLRVLEGW